MKPTKSHLSTPRIRFNFGFHDGVQAKRENWQPLWLACYQGPSAVGSHYDKIYIEGFWAGQDAVAAGESTESSETTWKARK